LETSSEGSGVIYKIEDDLAYIVTNNHVIDGADELEILMKDGTKEVATVVGSDVWTDLAVLTIPATSVTAVASFGDSDAVNVGEPAIAIGSPLGTEFATSVTQGIISAKNRSVSTDVDGDSIVDWDVTALQTDAAINPGNSGGALINIAGQVIGINSMKISDSNVEGMGFAIPSNDVLTIINELEQNGEIIRPILGVSMLDLSQISASQQSSVLTLPEDVTAGVVIAEVQALSAAELGGLEQYDVITEMNGEAVTSIVDLRKILYALEVGSDVEISYYRGGTLQSTTVTLTEGQTSAE
jgi:serine protease Do